MRLVQRERMRARVVVNVMEGGLVLAVAEAALFLALISKTDLRTPAIAILNQARQERSKSHLITRAIRVTFIAFLLSTLYSLLQVRQRLTLADSVNPTDHLLFAQNLLHASISGILLFLSLVIEKLHTLVIEGVSLEKNTEAEKKLLTQMKNHHAEQLIEHEFKFKRLKAVNRKLEFEFQTKMNEAEAARASQLALKSKSEEFQVEYYRLLEYNQILRNQLHSIDQRLQKDSQEKGWAIINSNVVAWGSEKTPYKSRHELGSDSKVIPLDQCDQFLCSSGLGKSSPRHRRPIFQH